MPACMLCYVRPRLHLCIWHLIAGRRRGGLMFSTVVSWSSVPGWSSGREHCLVILVKTLTEPLFTQVYKWVPVNLMLGEPYDGAASHPGISVTSKNVFKPKKLIPMLFPIKSRFRFSARAMKLTVQWKIGDEWRHFRNSSQNFVFILLSWRLHCFIKFGLFVSCRWQNPRHYWTRRIFGASWHDVSTHSESQTLFLHWLTVNFIGRGWDRNFEAGS